MKKFIAWLFILMAPFMLGTLITIIISGRVLHLSPENIAVAIQSFVWLILYATWFEDSEYQRML